MDDTLREDALAGRWLRRFFRLLALLVALAVFVAAPVGALWLYMSGDIVVSRAVDAQTRGFAIYGSALDETPADVLDYKMALYKAKRPLAVVAGSAGVMSMRDNVFAASMVNMAGTAGSLSELRTALDAMLDVHKPEIVLLALDFWWFSPAWEADPFARNTGGRPGPLTRALKALRMPWRSLTDGSVSPKQFLFLSFRDARFGTRAQFRDDGFGPDGSWYASSEVRGLGVRDIGFRLSLERAKRKVAEFTPSQGLSRAHLDAFADIYFRLRGRGVIPVVFIAPIAAPVLDVLKENESSYPHLFELEKELKARGVTVANTVDPRRYNGTSCEFLDGVRAGEVIDARLLRELAGKWTELLSYISMDQCNRLVNEWRDQAQVRTDRTREVWETDFLGLGCMKKTR